MATGTELDTPITLQLYPEIALYFFDHETLEAARFIGGEQYPPRNNIKPPAVVGAIYAPLVKVAVVQVASGMGAEGTKGVDLLLPAGQDDWLALEFDAFFLVGAYFHGREVGRVKAISIGFKRWLSSEHALSRCGWRSAIPPNKETVRRVHLGASKGK